MDEVRSKNKKAQLLDFNVKSVRGYRIFFSGGGGGTGVYLVAEVEVNLLCKLKKFYFPRGFLPDPAPTRFAHEKMQRQLKLNGHPYFCKDSNIVIQICNVWRVIATSI